MPEADDLHSIITFAAEQAIRLSFGYARTHWECHATRTVETHLCSHHRNAVGYAQGTYLPAVISSAIDSCLADLDSYTIRYAGVAVPSQSQASRSPIDLLSLLNLRPATPASTGKVRRL